MIPRSKGVALITAVLITAIASMIAASMLNRQYIDIRRTSNVITSDQAYLFALGIESWAQQILRRDANDNKTDHLNEAWATILPPMDVDGGLVSGYIEDMGGRFNLNNLLKQGTISTVSVQRFRNLLSALDLEPTLSDAVIDWIDENENITFPDGAEDNEYLAMEQPYRTANFAMQSISELKLIKGFDQVTIDTLAPHITAIDSRTNINLNTATAPVLMAVVEGLTRSAAETIIETRLETPFEAINDFSELPQLTNLEFAAEDLAVASKHFLAIAQTSFGNSQVTLYSLLERNNPLPVTIKRSIGAH